MPQQGFERREDDEANGRKFTRRQALGVGGTVLAGGVGAAYLAGLLDFRNQEDYAEYFADALSEDVEVEDYRVDLESEVLTLQYVTTGVVSHDLEVVGSAYADAVREGLALQLEATATGASKEWSYSISRELAREYLSGSIDEEEYHSRIME